MDDNLVEADVMTLLVLSRNLRIRNVSTPFTTKEISLFLRFFILFHGKSVFVILHEVHVLYKKYKDGVNAFAEKAMIELKKQYASVC